jgi:hypothetical protein
MGSVFVAVDVAETVSEMWSFDLANTMLAIFRVPYGGTRAAPSEGTLDDEKSSSLSTEMMKMKTALLVLFATLAAVAGCSSAEGSDSDPSRPDDKDAALAKLTNELGDRGKGAGAPEAGNVSPQRLAGGCYIRCNSSGEDCRWECCSSGDGWQGCCSAVRCEWNPY